jgi:GNAT superfamily N-acetyltransferase
MVDQNDALAKRMNHILMTEGLKGFLKRIEGRLRSKWFVFHVFLHSLQFASVSEALEFPARLDPMTIRMLEKCQSILSSITFKQVNESDEGEIDELTALDPWGGHSRKGIIEKLQGGWCCYVAKSGSRVVAFSWIKAGPKIYEDFFQRWLALADDEVYAGGAFCVPDWRGKGVSPMLTKWVVNHLALTKGVTKYIGWVKDDNVGQVRTLMQMGYRVVGRIGFIEMFGVRLHYVWGQKAFRLIKRLFFIQVSP